MQTFLPLSIFSFYSKEQLEHLTTYDLIAYSFYFSLSCLDNKRLGKQRVEANQLISIITTRKQFNLHNEVNKYTLSQLKKQYPEIKFGWINHPATLLWEDYLEELKLYFNICIRVWTSRKNVKGQPMKNNMPFHKVLLREQYTRVPWFLTNTRFTNAHQSALMFKEPAHYKQFKWQVEPKLDYIWTQQF